MDRDKILFEAVKVYGRSSQMIVAIEELCELSQVLAKFFRYENEDLAILELRDRAIDELADVAIVTAQVRQIFQVSERDLQDRINYKLGRLAFWLSEKGSFQQTLDTRSPQCKSCKYWDDCTDWGEAGEDISCKGWEPK